MNERAKEKVMAHELEQAQYPSSTARAIRQRIHQIARCGKSVAFGLVLCMSENAVAAGDMDIMMNDIQRHNEVASQCPALLKSRSRATDLDKYHKGLCLLYGVDGDAQEDKALPLLRMAAADGLIEAQLTLADTLQKGKDAEKIEALVWYRRAELAGDSRAGSRYDRLARRIDAATKLVAANTNPELPPGIVVNATRRAMSDLYQQGYHCHFMSFGRQFCHATSD
jgi:TPR repeat protein